MYLYINIIVINSNYIINYIITVPLRQKEYNDIDKKIIWTLYSKVKEDLNIKYNLMKNIL